MKNKVPKESVFKKKGFYVALYSSLAVVMVLAAVVSFGNLTPGSKQITQQDPAKEVDFSQMQATNLGSGETMQNYLTPSDRDDLALKPGASTAPTANPAVTPQSTTSPAPKPDTTSPQSAATPANEQSKPGVSNPAKPGVNEQDKPNTSEKAAPSAKPEGQERKTSEYPAENDELESANIAPFTAEYAEYGDRQSFSMFNEGDKMAWPVLGEVVMNFSDTHAIYDKTLDQYRTNDTLCIAADLGSQVVAAADGIIEKVAQTREDGNTVVINHGNGWLTTYSQLQDGVLVKEGDVVSKGQIIGGVASPSVYSVLLGNHIGFKVSKDDVLVDPISLLN